jgi:hypothetical protein
MKLMEIANDNDILEVLESEIKKVRINELNEILDQVRKGITKGNDEIDTVESEYEFNIEKLEKVKELKKKSIAKQTKFLNLIPYIKKEAHDDRNELATILTAGSILSAFDNEPETLPDTSLYLLSSAFIPVPLKNYHLYKSMINEELLDIINRKQITPSEKRSICYSILDCCEMSDSTKGEDLISFAERAETKSR